MVVGVGGSRLGAEAIYSALKDQKTLVPLFFLDAINPLSLTRIIRDLKKRNLKKGKILINLVSKSGKTFESLANFFTLLEEIKKYKPKIVVTTVENSPLWVLACNRNWTVLSIPEKIVGRYSVFSNAGLLSLFYAGVNIKDLLSGAKEANKQCLIDDPLKNPALASALITFYHWKKGKNIYSQIVFPPDLDFLGRWYRQLMAESLGKDGKGITPTVARGTTDFHSLGQLYFDGPKDKLTNFVFVNKIRNNFYIPDDKDLDVLLPGGPGKKYWELNKVIFEGIKGAYKQKRIPFVEIILSSLSERNLGFFMEMRMIEIILLAELMKVNAFNQPGVELYKQKTRNYLKNNLKI